MTDASLTLAGTRQVAEARRSAYVRFAGFAVALDVAGAAALIFAPSWAAAALGEPQAAAGGFITIAGVLALAAALNGAQGAANPLYARWPNLAGIAVRLLLAVTLLLIGGNFIWLAVLQAVLAVALAWAYLRALLAELMTRP